MPAKLQPKLNGNVAAAFLTLALVALLFFLPVVGAPLLIVTGFAWRGGPLWARIAMVAIAVSFGLWFLISQPFHM